MGKKTKVGKFLKGVKDVVKVTAHGTSNALKTTFDKTPKLTQAKNITSKAALKMQSNAEKNLKKAAPALRTVGTVGKVAGAVVVGGALAKKAVPVIQKLAVKSASGPGGAIGNFTKLIPKKIPPSAVVEPAPAAVVEPEIIPEEFTLPITGLPSSYAEVLKKKKEEEETKKQNNLNHLFIIGGIAFGLGVTAYVIHKRRRRRRPYGNASGNYSTQGPPSNQNTYTRNLTSYDR